MTNFTPEQREKLYISLIPKITEVARECGYAIGVHGSLRRDLDLIACPWVEVPANRAKLLQAITRVVDGTYRIENNRGIHIKKPQGRRAYIIMLPQEKYWGEDGSPYIDLSIMPKSK